mmetsp:Transcript_19159/g.62456  ORF Transcript_19159/g.62456 Transcript_19159/m.62456 type:complete len:335 (-) Transcript_19159:139-1143(-)
MACRSGTSTVLMRKRRSHAASITLDAPHGATCAADTSITNSMSAPVSPSMCVTNAVVYRTARPFASLHTARAFSSLPAAAGESASARWLRQARATSRYAAPSSSADASDMPGASTSTRRSKAGPESVSSARNAPASAAAKSAGRAERSWPGDTASSGVARPVGASLNQSRAQRSASPTSATCEASALPSTASNSPSTSFTSPDTACCRAWRCGPINRCSDSSAKPTSNLTPSTGDEAPAASACCTNWCATAPPLTPAAQPSARHSRSAACGADSNSGVSSEPSAAVSALRVSVGRSPHSFLTLLSTMFAQKNFTSGVDAGPLPNSDAHTSHAAG